MEAIGIPHARPAAAKSQSATKRVFKVRSFDFPQAAAIKQAPL
jgi:hypothetical protein